MVVQKQSFVASMLLISLMLLLVVSGCRTARERAQHRRRPQNTVFEAGEQIPKLQIPEGQNALFTLWNQTDTQSIHILQVGKGAKVAQRYHANHDLTLLCLSGSAIVEVEGERHFVESPSTVVIRRLWSYQIIPHRTDEDFTALLVYSPPFQGKDTMLMDE